jgi:hypothetical protein
MIVLFFKASSDAPPDDEPPGALPEKMRLILLTHVKEAKTLEERERAEREMERFEDPRS